MNMACSTEEGGRGEIIPIMYKKAIVEQYLYCSSTILLDPDLSPPDQLFIKRPG